MPQIELILPPAGRAPGDVVAVQLQASVTAIGTLKLEAIARAPIHRRRTLADRTQRATRFQRRSMTYHVGIDLGTTHTVVAYAARADVSAGRVPSDATVLALPQLVSASEIEALRLLPSFLYAPLASERVADPWQELPWIVGQYARQRGQGRSASAWSRRARAGSATPESPAAMAFCRGPRTPRKCRKYRQSKRVGVYSSTFGEVGDEAFAAHPLSEQSVVLTVPASFDEVARELTVRKPPSLPV